MREENQVKKTTESNTGVAKKHETIGCCGIDCGLCARFHTKGDSACPGCGGPDFREKHPSCGFLTCCAIKKGHAVCSFCDEYPCKRFDAEKQGFDSFVTHRKVFENLDAIKEMGIDRFIEEQKIRTGILKKLLTGFDDGRSKSFYCLACALLSLHDLKKISDFSDKQSHSSDIKEKSRQIKSHISELAESAGIELKLRNKKG